METNNTLPATIAGGIAITEVQQIISTAPATLDANRMSVAKATEVADALIANADQAGMSDALDMQMALYTDKCRKTIATMNERRKPFTQIVDALKKEFTSLEGELKTKVELVQSFRDGYASAKMEQQRIAQLEAQRKLNVEREVIELKQQAETGLAEGYAEHLRDAKEILLDKFNGATLDNIGDVMAEIASYSEVLTPDVYRGFAPKLSAKYNDVQVVDTITKAAMNSNYGAHKSNYSSEISILKLDLEGKKSSKIKELELLAKSEGDALAAIEEERNRRQREEKERLEQQAQQAKDKAAAAAVVEASAATAKAEINAATIVGSTTQVKESYEIILKDISANILIAQFWMVNEGKTLSQDKIDRMTFERMRRFCETQAIRTGEMIDSPYVEYIPKYKAK